MNRLCCVRVLGLCVIAFLLTGCSVFRDAGNELGKDLTGLKREFSQLYLREKLQ